MDYPVPFERRGNKSSANRIEPGPNLLEGSPPKVFITSVQTPKAFMAKVQIKPKRMVGSQDVVRAVFLQTPRSHLSMDDLSGQVAVVLAVSVTPYVHSIKTCPDAEWEKVMAEHVEYDSMEVQGVSDW